MFLGQPNAKILFVNDFLRVHCAAEKVVMSEKLMKPLSSAMNSAGLLSSDWAMTVIHPRTVPGGKDVGRLETELSHSDLVNFRNLLRKSEANVVVPLGKYALSVVTGLTSIDKWHCNIVQATAEFGFRKCIPLFHTEHIRKVFSDHAYLVFGCTRIKDESLLPAINTPDREFVLGPDFDTSINLLESLHHTSDGPLAIDIETGGGLINTVGFASSERAACALKTLPEFYSPEEYLKLWQAIARVLEGPRPKVLQNFIYEATWFARYGIEMKNTVHDTMWAMKFLHPEFEKGLHNVGRLYTPFPYWKDDNDDWANIRDWSRHLDYNCKDTTGTFAAFIGQTRALEKRGLHDLFQGYLMRLAPVIQEMCACGLKVDPAALASLHERLTREKENHMRIIDQEATLATGETINPRSPQQVKSLLKVMGMKLPVQKDKESSDKKALVKLRKKHPDAPILQSLIGLSAVNKQLSSYINFEYDKTNSRVHYQFDGCGTETGRWAAYNSGWGEGFNPQTVPKKVRNCFVADPGFTLLQVDLKQAESRYVAWESPEPKLMEMLDNGDDIHKYVAAQIFNKPAEIVNPKERQLGKKSGHAANYGVGPRTFAEACLVEEDVVLTELEAKRIINTYFELFPGIRGRQVNIQKEIRAKRLLRTPIGRERYFYGRMNDSTFREAYAYTPQSTIPDITNHLLLKLWENREYLEINRFLLQVHDSLLIELPLARVPEVAALTNDLRAWHPKIQLPGGELWIPVEVEVGERWGKMEVV